MKRKEVKREWLSFLTFLFSAIIEFSSSLAAAVIWCNGGRGLTASINGGFLYTSGRHKT